MSTNEERCAFDYLIRTNSIDVFKLLLKNPNVSSTIDYSYVLKAAAACGNIEMVKSLIEEAPADLIDACNVALASAAESGHTEVVQLLLTQTGVDPAADHSFAIRSAACKGHADVVKLLLLDSRSDPSILGNLAIRLSSAYGHTEVVKLLSADPRVDLKTDDYSSFVKATQNGHAETLRFLLSIDTPPEAIQLNIIAVASYIGNVEMISIWLEQLGHRANADMYEKFDHQKFSMPVKELWMDHLLTHCSKTREIAKRLMLK